MIQAEHLSKRYGNREVVSNLTFTVQKNEILGFIGANGAGKSTTIKMLCGVLPVYAGSVHICGIDLMANPLTAKGEIGYLPENAPLPSSMTVLSFLDYAASMHGLHGTSKSSAIANALECCSLTNVTGMEIETLSKGYKRRVSLAQTLLHKPSVLLLDEPTDGLDPNQKREIRNLIQVLRQDTAIVISTHILEEVQSVCTNVLLLNQGKNVFYGSVEDFVEKGKSLCCEAFTLLPADVSLAATILRKNYPGTVRINGNKMIVPTHAGSEQIAAILDKNGVKIQATEKLEASLDDVFSAFTVSETARRPQGDQPQTQGSEVPGPAPQAKEDDDD